MVIRKRIWEVLEEKNYARPPRPVHGRIPNFEGAEAAAKMLCSLPEWKHATWVKIDPDSPQRPVRRSALEQRKMMLTPQPRIKTGFFYFINPDTLLPSKYREAATIRGFVKYGKPIGLSNRADLKIDLIVVGSVAVNPETGARLGKGEGFSDIEYAILRHMGVCTEHTPVVTTVHDCQLTAEVAEDIMSPHDLPCDIIVTPTQIIRTKPIAAKPTGIYWQMLTDEKLKSIAVLRKLKAQVFGSSALPTTASVSSASTAASSASSAASSPSSSATSSSLSASKTQSTHVRTKSESGSWEAKSSSSEGYCED